MPSGCYISYIYLYIENILFGKYVREAYLVISQHSSYWRYILQGTKGKEGGHGRPLTSLGADKSIVRVESVYSALRPEFRVSRHPTNEGRNGGEGTSGSWRELVHSGFGCLLYLTMPPIYEAYPEFSESLTRVDWHDWLESVLRVR